jgi:flagellar export protein FliJ
MKRFRFPLTPVQAVRMQAKARAREVLAGTLRELAKAEAEQDVVHRRMAELERALRAGRTAGGNAAQAAHTYAAYIRELADEKACEARVAEVRKTVEHARQAYTEAHRRVEVIDRLETKARATYRLDCLREEQAEFDDLAGRRHAQRTTQFAL